MEIFATEFWCPKSGSTEAEYEDASAIAKDKSRFAVADGAAETSFSGVWAKQLVRAFADKRLSIPIVADELKPLQSKWQKIVHRHPLPWYAEEKVYDGAFAAFVGLEILGGQSTHDQERTWRATAAGDSCLIQVRGQGIVESFPLTSSSPFNDRPNLLGSVNGHSTFGTVLKSEGIVSPDDVFFLLTDAIACWFLKEYEHGNRPWDLLETQDKASFQKFVTQLRIDGRIKNDDVTLVRIDLIG